MQNFIKSSDAPKTKLQLRKAIESGKVIVFEKNSKSYNQEYIKLDKQQVSNLIKSWGALFYNTKHQNKNDEAYGCLGASYYYKFSNAN